MANNRPPFGFGFGPSGDDANQFFNNIFQNGIIANGGNQTATINIEQVRQIARQVISGEKEPFVGNRDIENFTAALDLANTWLDEVMLFPRSESTLHNRQQVAWTRQDWIDSSLKTWHSLVEPLAAGMANALMANMGELTQEQNMDFSALGEMGINPEFFQSPQFLDQIKGMMRLFIGAIIGGQLGQSIGQLAMNITGSLDVGVPLNGAHMIGVNVTKWGEGLGLREDEIRIFLSLREAAAARLFQHTPWISTYLTELMTEYGRGIQIDLEKMREQAETALMSGQIDPNNPQGINIALNAGLFTPEKTERQEKCVEKIETFFALLDGWIDHVTFLSAHERLPSFNLLNENHRRARAISAPVQKLFASLLGSEISPKLTREATKFWQDLYELKGLEARDQRWEEVALLPTAADFGDAKKFLEGFEVPDDLSGLFGDQEQ